MSRHLATTACLVVGVLWHCLVPAATDKCDFEKGLCAGFVSNCSLGACFKVQRVDTMKFGPTLDRNPGRADGSCAYATGRGVAKLDRSFQGPFCFTGWYHVSGTQIPFVIFYSSPQGAHSRVFHRAPLPFLGSWHKVVYTETRPGPVTVTISTDLEGLGASLSLALDDLSFQPGPCPSAPKDGSCNFDWGDACGYSVGNETGQWNLNRWIRIGTARSRITAMDVTTGFGGGYAVYLPRPKGKLLGVLSSPKLEGSARNKCLSFFYYIPTLAKEKVPHVLEVFTKGADKTRQSIWKLSSDALIHNTWSPAQISFSAAGQFQVEFECSHEPGSYIGFYCAVDYVRLSDCARPQANHNLDCDFEEGLCSWLNVEGDDVGRGEWRLGGGTIKTTLPKPSMDHTLKTANNGSYLYFSNFMKRKGTKAHVVSEAIISGLQATDCMDFWYIVAGDEDTKLRLLSTALQNDARDWRSYNVMWEAEIGKFDNWLHGRIALSDKTRVIFEAEAGSGKSLGYVALDDIKVYANESCETLPKRLPGHVEVDRLLSCDFSDQSFCNWAFRPRISGVRWRFGYRASQYPSRSNIGPVALPAGTKGDYIFASEATILQNRGALVLTSPMVPEQTQPVCGIFRYHMFGALGASLKISLEKNTGDGSPGSIEGHIFVDHRGRSSVDRWFLVRRTLDMNGRFNQITISFMSWTYWPAEMAVGPMEFTPGPCQQATDIQGWCDFEYDTCQWNVGDASTGWKLQTNSWSGFNSHIHSGPPDSHSFLELRKDRATKDSVVTSPSFQGRPEAQCLKFWYRRDNVSLGRIVVELVPGDGSQRTVLWEQPPYPKVDWMLARVPIAFQKEFQVVFKAKGVNLQNPGTSFGIDDLQLDPEPCRPLFECDLDEDLCGYVNDFQTVGLQWLVGTGRLSSLKRPSRLSPPPSSSADASGDEPISWKRFAYVDLSIQVVNWTQITGGDTVRMLSPIFEVGDKGDGLQLTYFRAGPDIASMKLTQVEYKDNTGVPGTLQTLDLPEGQGWQSIQMKLKPSKQSQVIVALTRGKGSDGDAAIGSISAAVASAQVPAGEASLSCDFEKGTFCGWEPSTGEMQFKLNDPANHVPPSPSSDHTLKAYKGRFIFVENPDGKMKNATLRSPQFPPDFGREVCISFWHASPPNTKGFIALNISRPNSLKLWRDSSNTVHFWAHEITTLNLPKSADRLYLEAYLFFGLIAIDDLQITPGSCPQRDKCTFEIGSPCPLYLQPSTLRRWVISSSRSLKVPDHTLQDNKGYFLFLNTSKIDPAHPESRVYFSTRKPTPATCVTFWWKGLGYRSDLNVYVHNEGTLLRDPVLSLYTDPTPGRWNPRTVTISSRTQWQLVFEAVSYPNILEASGVMLDDVEFTDGNCPRDDLCTFEEDLCIPWVDVTPYVAESVKGWQLQRAGSFNELPRDHTLGSEDGYYLLFRGTGNTRDSAVLTLREHRFSCASIWYYVSNSTRGCSIQVPGQLLDKATRRWKRSVFDIDRYSEDGVTIRANSGEDTSAFVAIDDMQVSKLQCSEIGRPVADNFVCGTVPESSIPPDRVCDFVVDCSNGADEVDCGNCDFAKTTCGWNLGDPGSRKSMRWQRTRVGDLERSPKLNSNETTDGHYMILVQEESKYTTETAVASSPVIRNTNFLCAITFWYNYENNTNPVFLQLEVKGYEMTVWDLLAKKPAKPKGTWNYEGVLIGRYPGEVKLNFLGIDSRHDAGYFVIDTIEYANCGLPQPEHSCEDGFRCANGACISRLDVCNYVDHCGDGSDELNCGDHSMGCNFDTSFCDWKPIVPSEHRSAYLKWVRSRPGSYLRLSPTRDHTTGLPEGYFLHLRSRSVKVESEIAGPVLQGGGSCAVTFFYVIYNGAPSTLTVGLRYAKNGPIKRVWRTKNHSGFFHFVNGFVSLIDNKPFQVFFIGTHEATNDAAYISIDDVSFAPGCRPYKGILPEAPVTPPTTEAPACPVGQFTCVTSRQCIPQAQVCDFKKHCADGSDEKDCGQCDFSTDMCGLTTDDPNGKFTWKRTLAAEVKQNPSRNYGLPTSDRENNPQGSYAAFRLTNPDVPRTDANALVTPPLGQMAHACTVSFYAFLAHPNSALWFGVQRNITPKTSRRKRFFLLTSAESNQTWTKLNVKVGNWNPGARFYFMTNQNHTSIDGIAYRGCHPDRDSDTYEDELRLSCEFSYDDTCGWFPENLDDELDWTKYAGGVVTRPWQPPADDVGHSGPYMFIRNPWTVEASGHLVSKKVEASGPNGRCFSFWYNMRHPNSGTLNLYLRTADNSSDLIWTRSGPQGRAWLRGYADTLSDTLGNFVLEAVLPGSTPAVIAVDNIEVTSMWCKSKTVCDFENDNCGWTLHDWEIKRGQSGIQPRIDYTTGTASGHYARLLRSNGRLVSPQLRGGESSSRRCVKFWHYLSGGETETLNVSRVTNFRNEETVWSVRATQVRARRWLPGSAELLGYEGPLMAVFTGSTSGNSDAAVAVDDVVIDPYGCPAGSCQFEEDFCNWRNFGTNSNTMRWYRNSGPTMSAGGPSVDHTLKTKKGHYLLLDAQDLAKVQIGVLDSELLSYGPNVCFRMFYHMDQGSDAKITIHFLGVSGESEFGYKLQAPGKNNWTLFQQDVVNLPSIYRVRIIGIPGSKRKSDIAIDDIEVLSGKCSGERVSSTEVPLTTIDSATSPTDTTPTKRAPLVESTTSEATSESVSTASAEPRTQPVLACRPGEFNCRDGEHCIPSALLCDGVKDCPNGLDEKCGALNQCEQSSVFCPSGSPDRCIGRDLLCNGRVDCSDGSDESLCGNCPASFCLNGGHCDVVNDGRPTCTCPDGASGKRCQNIARGSADLQQHSTSSTGWAIAVPVLLILVGVAIIGFLYQRRRKAMRRSPPLILNNPSYDTSFSET